MTERKHGLKKVFKRWPLKMRKKTRTDSPPQTLYSGVETESENASYIGSFASLPERSSHSDIQGGRLKNLKTKLLSMISRKKKRSVTRMQDLSTSSVGNSAPTISSSKLSSSWSGIYSEKSGIVAGTTDVWVYQATVHKQKLVVGSSGTSKLPVLQSTDQESSEHESGSFSEDMSATASSPEHSTRSSVAESTHSSAPAIPLAADSTTTLSKYSHHTSVDDFTVLARKKLQKSEIVPEVQQMCQKSETTIQANVSSKQFSKIYTGSGSARQWTTESEGKLLDSLLNIDSKTGKDSSEPGKFVRRWLVAPSSSLHASQVAQVFPSSPDVSRTSQHSINLPFKRLYPSEEVKRSWSDEDTRLKIRRRSVSKITPERVKIKLGVRSVITHCPFCKHRIMTAISHHIGKAVWCLAFALCLIFPACIIIPFLFRAVWDVHHKCPNCDKLIGVFKP